MHIYYYVVNQALVHTLYTAGVHADFRCYLSFSNKFLADRYGYENHEANLGVIFVGATNQGEGMKNVSQPNHNNILRCSPLPG